jgi:hypothetical protein
MISGVELSQSAAACMLSPIWYTTPCWISTKPNLGASYYLHAGLLDN